MFLIVLRENNTLKYLFQFGTLQVYIFEPKHVYVYTKTLVIMQHLLWLYFV